MDWDFSANPTLADDDALAKVPEGFRAAYEKGDNGYSISAAYKPFVDAVTGLNGALRKERDTSKALKSQKDVTDQLRDTFGVESLDDLKAKLDEQADQLAQNAKVDPAKIKADIQRTFDADMAKKDGELKTMQSTLDRYLVKGEAARAIAAAKGNSVLLEPHITARTKVVKDGDEYVVRVLDAAGDYRGDGKGGFMGVEDLVAEMKQDKTFAGAFESEALSGAHERDRRPQPSQIGRTQGGRSRDDMSPTEMLSAGLQQRRRR